MRRVLATGHLRDEASPSVDVNFILRSIYFAAGANKAFVLRCLARSKSVNVIPA